MSTWMVGYQHPYTYPRRVSPRAVAFVVIYGQAWLWDFYVIYKKMQGQTLSEFVATLLAKRRTRWIVVAGLGWNIAHFISLARHLHRGTTPGALGMPFRSQRQAREPRSEAAQYAMDNLGAVGWLP